MQAAADRISVEFLPLLIPGLVQLEVFDLMSLSRHPKMTLHNPIPHTAHT